MAFTMVMVLLLPVAALSFNVELMPRDPLFRAGDRQTLSCSAKGCENPTFVWTSLEDKPLMGQSQTVGSQSFLTLDPVTRAHENLVVCKVRCGSLLKSQHTSVRVYSFPSDPVISGNDHMLVGQENVLTCKVPDVYPSEYLEIEWLQGNKVVHTDEGRVDVSTVSSRYTFTPTTEDNGKTITCRASHSFEGVPKDQKIKETLASLNVQYAPRDIKISEAVTVKMGASFQLTCSAEGNPRPVTLWRKQGQSEAVGYNETLVIHNATTFHSGEYECETRNMLGDLSATVSVIVQGPPRNTTIVVSPTSGLKEGDSVTISCHSDMVPAGRMALHRVSEDQRTELQSSLDSSTSISLPSIQLADSGLYECEAVNEHGSQRASAQVSVAVHPLEVVIKPGEGMITAERGSSLVLACSATNCSNPAFFWKTLLDGPVHNHAETRGSTSKLFFSPVELGDERAYTCEVKCGSVRKVKHTEIKVFSFPTDPVIESSAALREGEESVLLCTVRDVFPASLLQIQWLDEENKVLLTEDGSFDNALQNMTSVLSFTPTADDQGRQITCRATLKMEGVPLSRRQKSAVTTVTLQYAPKNTTIAVSPATVLKEGDSVTISCHSDMVPAGRMALHRVSEDQRTELQSSPDSSTSITLPSIQLADSGLYECEAVNEHGSQRASAQVIVKGPPRNTTVQVLPSPYVHEGQNITICCKTVSFPPPAVILKLGNGTEIYSPDGNFLLVNLTPSDAGEYQVNVTNDLGYETEIFTISVLERQSSPPPSWNDIVIPVIGLGGLVMTATVTGLVVHYLNQARKRGSYELAKCNPSTV
ncbi:hypothetical protein MATL_G00027470 [Megalops atlanticus]|uniref:Ig-like domain-containing protein n=1 Tax=Megalops atlanticus TaxID=7932 RepID=A0A9D3QFV8_MEGAT|nr:hypothetical protein MATL_G00027470 [Megalops atlanticus]